jgi:hypothetical protein
MPLRTRTKGKANVLIHLTDLDVAAGEAEVAVVEIVMVIERIVVNEDVAEAEETEVVVDVEEAEVDSEDSITMMIMRTVEDSAVDSVMILVVVILDLVVDSAVVTVKIVVSVAEEEDVVEAHHEVNVIVVIKKVILCVNALNQPQRDKVTMPPRHLIMRTAEDLAEDLAAASAVDLVVLKVMMEIDQQDVEDSGDVEEDEVVEAGEDHVNLIDAVEMIRAVQLKHLTNETDLERTIGEHQEMN